MPRGAEQLDGTRDSEMESTISETHTLSCLRPQTRANIEQADLPLSSISNTTQC